MTDEFAHRPLAARVEAMTGFGLSATDIAIVLQVEEAELRNAYAHELDAGQIKANTRVAENLYRKATGDGREAVTAAIFWLKTRARWKETSVHEHAVDPQSNDLTSWTDEMLEKAIQSLLPHVSENDR